MKFKQSLVVCVLFAAVTLCYLCGLMDVPDLYVSDVLHQSQRPVSPNIFVIGIDEDTLENYGAWGSWSRKNAADLIAYLSEDPQYAPAVIGVDILFAGPSADPQADAALVQAAENAGNVVFASQAVFAKTLAGDENGGHWDYGSVRKVEEPFDALKAVSRSGSVNVLSDEDGVVRSCLYTLSSEGGEVSCFADEIYRLYAEKAGITQPHVPPLNRRGGFHIPFAAKPGDYYGTAGKGTSWLRVMNGEIPRALFEDAVVLIGPYSAGMMDAYYTSASRSTPMYGVEVHANILQSLMEGLFKRPVGGLADILAAGLLCLAIVFFYRKLNIKKTTLALVLLCAAYAWGNVLFYQGGYILSALYPLLACVLTYLALLVSNYILITLEKAVLYVRYHSLFYHCIQTIASSIDAKDTCTSGHCKRVAHYSMMIGQAMGLEKEDLQDLEYTAILHDVGKIGIADSILKKRGPLTNEEFAEMRTHPLKGAVILEGIEEFNAHITEGTRYHHERYDGKGYNLGCKEKEIPLYARIIAVADSYDAMTQNRPYRGKMSRQDALDEVERNAGTQFDPEIARIFVDLIHGLPYAEYEESPPEPAETL